jgi:hypothetical protein
MKKPLLAITFIAFPLSAKTTRLRNYGCIAIVLLAGCTSTQVRWDATRMREEVMVYYNDQIMDNLIRAKTDVPFVHVDITLLTSQGSSQISGSIGYGEATTNTGTQQLTKPVATNTSGTTLTQAVATTTGATPSTTTTNTIGSTLTQAVAGAVGVVNTATHLATRPFSYSVTPQQTESLGITAAPALGSQAVLKKWPPKPSQSDDSDWEETKKTTVEGKTATESAPKKPETVSMYEAYKTFAREHVICKSARPKDNIFVPGTLRRWKDGNYYYVDDKVAYYNFCTRLFTKTQASASSLQAQLQQIQGQVSFH